MVDPAPAELPRGGRVVAWQGWRLSLRRRWDPVQLSGDATAGYALFADAYRPRLGLRWQTPRRRRRFDAEAAVRSVLVAEVGRLAAAEARAAAFPNGSWTSPLLYVEPDPPGRDVWAAFSPASGRLVTVACPVRRREHVLGGSVLPTLSEVPLDRAAPWAIFDLNLTVPAGFRLVDRRLNAGDLSLGFADRRGATLAVRQVAVADLALRRRPLDGWLADPHPDRRRHYRAGGPPTDVSLRLGGRSLVGRAVRLVRRRRFALAAWHPPTLTTLAVHDRQRDRLLILQGTDPDLLGGVANTIGVAD